MPASEAPSLSGKTSNTFTSLTSFASESQDISTQVSTVDFVDYIENARVSREEQNAARLEDDNYAALRHLRFYLLTHVPHLLFTVTKVCKFLRLKAPDISQEQRNEFPRAWLDRNTRRFSVSEQRPGSNRTASCIGVFFLITSVVAPPNWNVYIFPHLGFGLAIFFEFAFAAASYFASWSLWQIFLALDSFRCPIKTYQDLAHRIFGKWIGRIILAIQSVDIMFAIGITIMTGARWLNALATNLEVGTICYPLACMITTILMICLAEIRLLNSFKWIATLSFVASLLRFAIALATSWRVKSSISVLTTNFEWTETLTPTKAVFNYPGTWAPGFSGTVQPWASGMSNIQMSYWGNNIFTEFMAEMRDVHTFRRALRWAWIWFFTQRVLVGIVIYSQQGQYSVFDPFVFPWAATEHSIRPLVATCNLLHIIFLVVQAATLANIALKVIFRGTLNKVGATTRWNVRRISSLWAVAAPIYLIVVYLLAMCLPHYDAMFMIFFPIGWGFTAYGLPPLLYLGYCWRMYQLLPLTKETDSAARRNATNLEPANSWLSQAKRQRLLCFIAVLVLLTSLVISSEEMWEAVAGLRYNLKYAANIVSKPRITSCQFAGAI